METDKILFVARESSWSSTADRNMLAKYWPEKSTGH